MKTFLLASALAAFAASFAAATEPAPASLSNRTESACPTFSAR